MSWEYFDKPWNQVKSEIIFNQLPVLVVKNVTKIAQSGAIIRYLTNLTKMLPDNDILAANVDTIFETAHEIFLPLNLTVNFVVGVEFEKAKNTIVRNVYGEITEFRKNLNNLSYRPIFIGDKPFYCDFCVYHHLLILRLLDSNIFNKFSNFYQFMNSK